MHCESYFLLNLFTIIHISSYGNWLIDNRQMKWPGYMFVVCNTIVPAFIRLGQLPAQITVLSSAVRVGRILKLVDKEVDRVEMQEASNLEDKRKEFLVNYIKAEIGSPKEVCFHKSEAELSSSRLWMFIFP